MATWIDDASEGPKTLDFGPYVGWGLFVILYLGMMIASPLLAIFGTCVITAGVGMRYAFADYTIPSIVIVDGPLMARDYPPEPFSSPDEFAARFELRYNPICGSYPDKNQRTILFEQFWDAVKDGKVDGFALYAEAYKNPALTGKSLADVMALVVSTREN